MKNLQLLLFGVIVSLCACDNELDGSLSDSECIDTNCADYSSRWEAQQDFEWNPECRSDLDADNDGWACEENNWTDYYNSTSNGGSSGSGNSGCPTTSSCGCSGKNKAPCQADSCCRWVVGEGCGCS